jgi:hypothetical protein
MVQYLTGVLKGLLTVAQLLHCHSLDSSGPPEAEEEEAEGVHTTPGVVPEMVGSFAGRLR